MTQPLASAVESDFARLFINRTQFPEIEPNLTYI